MLKRPSEKGGFSYSLLKRQGRVLNKNYEFARVYKYGKSIATPLVVVYANRQRGEGLRLGISASKKIGNAVARNRARRVVKAALDGITETPVGGREIVLVCRSRAALCKTAQMRAALIKAFCDAGVIEE